MTNKELQKVLKEYPDDFEIVLSITEPIKNQVFSLTREMIIDPIESEDGTTIDFWINGAYKKG